MRPISIFCIAWGIFCAALWYASPYSHKIYHLEDDIALKTVSVSVPICKSESMPTFSYPSGAFFPITGAPGVQANLILHSGPTVTECVPIPLPGGLPRSAADMQTIAAASRAFISSVTISHQPTRLHLIIIGDAPSDFLAEVESVSPVPVLAMTRALPEGIRVVKDRAINPAVLPAVPPSVGLMDRQHSVVFFSGATSGKSVIHAEHATLVNTNVIRSTAALARLIVYDTPTPTHPIFGGALGAADALLTRLTTLPLGQADTPATRHACLASAIDGLTQPIVVDEALGVLSAVDQAVRDCVSEWTLNPNPPYVHHLAMIGVLCLPPSINVLVHIIKSSKKKHTSFFARWRQSKSTKTNEEDTDKSPSDSKEDEDMEYVVGRMLHHATRMQGANM